MTFSGSLQPPLLGAAIASARIHLSEEITMMQQELIERISLFNQLMQEKALPLIFPLLSPIRFVPLGPGSVTQNLMRRLMEEGLFPNIAGFPATPLKQSGIRIIITRHHTSNDIHALVDALAHHLPLALGEEGYDLDAVSKFFKRSLSGESGKS